MCVVIDANQAHKFSVLGDHPHFIELIKWIKRGGTVVSGGKLHRELFRVKEMREWLITWEQAGRLKVYTDNVIEECEQHLGDVYESDDPHIIALAIVSGADTFVTEDAALGRDLKNPSIVGVRRRVYPCAISANANLARHRNLLRRSDC